MFKTLFEPAVDPWVFKPPFTTRAVGQGTGLGLSMSHSIIKAHGGSLLYESQYGEWTKVTVTIPINGV